MKYIAMYAAFHPKFILSTSDSDKLNILITESVVINEDEDLHTYLTEDTITWVFLQFLYLSQKLAIRISSKFHKIYSRYVNAWAFQAGFKNIRSTIKQNDEHDN